MVKYRIETGGFAAYRRADSAERAAFVLFAKMRRAGTAPRGIPFRDATSSWTVKPATRQPRG